MYERHVFRQMFSQAGESFDEFVARLCKQARLCEFGQMLEEQIRDQLVACVKSDELRKKLLSIAKLTLESALTECRLWDQSSRQSSAMSSSDLASPSTHAVAQQSARTSLSSSNPSNFDRKYYRCNHTGLPVPAIPVTRIPVSDVPAIPVTRIPVSNIPAIPVTRTSIPVVSTPESQGPEVSASPTAVMTRRSPRTPKPIVPYDV